ncbi:MAG: histidine kinase [Chloroflexota bacterium]|nr:histidine kinase [Chloroflexota bacterium]
MLIGALALLVESRGSLRDLAAAAGLFLLSAIHVLYWWRPWPSRQRRAVAAVAAMVLINFVLLNLLLLPQPLLWLYPALIAGAGLRAPLAAIGVGLTALAAAAPLALEGRLIHPVGPVNSGETLGPSHSILLSIVLAGLGMIAVRQLIALNVDLHATRAELADLAVASERERLARELHDLLGRTLSLIAVKAELASRLSARGDPSADAELADVQRLARQAVRDVREAVAGDHTPSVDGELAAALRTAGIEVSIANTAVNIDPAHETTIAGALREAVTNVLKHSGARTCRITLDATDGPMVLEVEDDGRGPGSGGTGTGLDALRDRIHSLGGALEIGPSDGRGFRLRVRLGAAAPSRHRELAR